MSKSLVVFLLVGYVSAQRQFPSTRITPVPASSSAPSKQVDFTLSNASKPGSTLAQELNFAGTPPSAGPPAAELPKPGAAQSGSVNTALIDPRPASIPEGSGPISHIEGVLTDPNTDPQNLVGPAVMPSDHFPAQHLSPETAIGGMDNTNHGDLSSMLIPTGHFPMMNQMENGFLSDQMQMLPMLNNFGSHSGLPTPVHQVEVHHPLTLPHAGFPGRPLTDNEHQSAVAFAIIGKILEGAPMKLSLITESKLVYENGGKSSSISSEENQEPVTSSDHSGNIQDQPSNEIPIPSIPVGQLNPIFDSPLGNQSLSVNRRKRDARHGRYNRRYGHFVRGRHGPKHRG